jgi:hypothetical protein
MLTTEEEHPRLMGTMGRWDRALQRPLRDDTLRIVARGTEGGSAAYKGIGMVRSLLRIVIGSSNTAVPAWRATPTPQRPLTATMKKFFRRVGELSARELLPV